jgi:hypothetical protein
MTESEFKSWINSNIIPDNKKRSITGAIANELAHKCIDFFAHKDSVLRPYTRTITNIQLTGGVIEVTHNLDTWIPDVIMRDENNIIIGNEYFDAQSISPEVIRFTFLDEIPVTGNGYYSVTICKITDDIPLPPIEGFYDAFTDWEGEGINLKPFGYTIANNNSANYCVNDGNKLKMICPSGAPKLILRPPYSFILNKTYKVELQLLQGNLMMSNPYNEYGVSTGYAFFANTGIISWTFIAHNQFIELMRYTESIIKIGYIKIVEVQ